MLAITAACGGTTGPTPLKNSPEPAEAPPPAQAPAGQVVTIDADQPEGVVVTPGTVRIVVAARRPGELLVLDPTHLRRRPLVHKTDGAARHLQLDGTDVLVPGEDTAVLSVVDPLSGTVESSTAVGTHPHDAAAADGAIVVTEEDNHAVSIVRDSVVVKRLSGPDTPGGIAASGDRAGAVAVRGRLLYVIDVPSARIVAKVPVGAGPTHAVEVGPGVLAVADTTGDDLLLVQISGTRPRVISRTHLAGRPYGMATDTERHALWVATGADNRLHRLAITGTGTSTRLSLGASSPTVRQPNSLAVVPSTGAVVVVGATHPGTVELVGVSGSSP